MPTTYHSRVRMCLSYISTYLYIIYEFLAQMGIELRLRRLLQSCSDRDKQDSLIKSYNFLMDDMGERFLTICIFPKTLSGILEKRGGPAGFALACCPSKSQGY